MKYKQKLIHVSADYYDELIISIQDQIDNLQVNMEIQQIDYFNMKDEEAGLCQAFILFKPKLEKMEENKLEIICTKTNGGTSIFQFYINGIEVDLEELIGKSFDKCTVRENI